jgi:hypothetical protein
MSNGNFSFSRVQTPTLTFFAQGVGTIDMCPTSSSTSSNSNSDNTTTPMSFAQMEYQAISGCPSSSLPVEADCIHLLEACLTDEIMTPTVWSDGGNIFSRITIGWLQDLGYTVDYSHASPFPPSRLGNIPGCNCNHNNNRHSPR